MCTLQSSEPPGVNQQVNSPLNRDSASTDQIQVELSRLTRQCLDRRIEDLELLNAELAAWQDATNEDQRQVHWHFTTGDARIKLRHLYPGI